VSAQTRHANHTSSQTKAELAYVNDSIVSTALCGNPCCPSQFYVLMREHNQTKN